MLSANTVIIPPTAIYSHFQTTWEPPELCVSVDSLQSQIKIPPWFMNGQKKSAGNLFVERAKQHRDLKYSGVLPFAFNKESLSLHQEEKSVPGLVHGLRFLFFRQSQELHGVSIIHTLFLITISHFGFSFGQEVKPEGKGKDSSVSHVVKRQIEETWNVL